MKASRKDYEKVAALLAKQHSLYKDPIAWRVMVNEMADILARANPAFSRSIFVGRCIDLVV